MSILLTTLQIPAKSHTLNNNPLISMFESVMSQMISEKTGWYRSCYSVATSTSPVSNKTSLKTMKSILVNIARVIALCAVVAVVSATARAQLNPLYQFNGNGNWSLSAVGGGSTPVGNLLAQVPTGSTVVQAYLFSSQYYTPFTPDVTLGATTYSGSSWTALGLNTSSDLPLEAWVANVTPQMKALIGGGSVSQFSIPVFGNVGNGHTDIFEQGDRKLRNILWRRCEASRSSSTQFLSSRKTLS